MLRQLGLVVVAATFCFAAPALPAAAKEGAVTPGVTSLTAAADVSAQKMKRVRKPAVRRMAAAPAPYYQQCFLFFCNNGRPFPWLVLGVAY